MSLDTGHDFRTARMLMKHYLQNHGTVPPLLENMKKYFCSNCPNVYTTKESFKSHVKHMHSNKPKKYERSKIRFQCPYCEKTYCGSKPLQDHIVLKHEKSPKFQCEICQGRYPSEVIFREHMKRVHAKGQIISKCPFGVIVWTKIPTKFIPGFLLNIASKKRSYKKIRELYKYNT